jgi:GIT coiled-coil Rho guanine nucleotide exchange factor
MDVELNTNQTNVFRQPFSCCKYTLLQLTGVWSPYLLGKSIIGVTYESIDQDFISSCAILYMQLMTAPTKSSVPITVDEYHELKHALEESQLKMQQLMKSNITLGEEVAMLQNMVSAILLTIERPIYLLREF